jgi:hypothetical protein
LKRFLKQKTQFEPTIVYSKEKTFHAIFYPVALRELLFVRLNIRYTT